VFGALGGRWDQSLANVLLAAAPHLSGLKIRLVADHTELAILRAGDRLNLLGRVGDTVSLIPLCGDALGVTTAGLSYPLDDEALAFGATRGISNLLVSEAASVYLTKGILLCLHLHSPSS
jgi:thiamine pyrophosphokinase